MKTFAALFFSVLALVAAPSVSFASDVDALVQRARELKLDQKLQWLRFVHYRRKTNSHGEWLSEVDDPTFFAAPLGKFDPRAELEATLRVGFAGGDRPIGVGGLKPMPLVCRFPARWKWLMKELEVTDFRQPSCPDLENFREKVTARSVTMIFSGYFVNNPSTVFGHVLLRFNKQPHGARLSGSELLDTGVSYAANPTTKNPLLYAVMGMTGLFTGTFTAIPYYYKVREYSDAESRDLWEYDLVLSPEEVERLVDHIWELGTSWFDYWYFDENCAYQLLAALEGAAPRLELLKRVPFYVIPVDSVKAIAEEPGLVGAIRYRPSTARVLAERFETLSGDERRAFLSVRDSEKPADGVKAFSLSAEGEARVLDAVLDHIDFKFFRELVYKTDAVAAARKQNVLLARARMPSGGELTVPVTERDRPDRGHPVGRWWVGGGAREDSRGSLGVLDFEVRFALHDIFDPLDGYLPAATTEFWRMRGRYIPAMNRPEMQSFSLFTASSLAPVSRLEFNPSWRVQMGAERVRDRRCDNCLAANGEFLGGASVAPWRPLLVYGLVGPIGETSDGFARQKWLASGAARVGLRFLVSHDFRLGAEGEWRRVFDEVTFDRLRLHALARWDFERGGRHWFGLEADYTNEVGYQDGFLKWVRFF